MATEKFTTELVITNSGSDQAAKGRLQETIRMQQQADRARQQQQVQFERQSAERTLQTARAQATITTQAAARTQQLLRGSDVITGNLGPGGLPAPRYSISRGRARAPRPAMDSYASPEPAATASTALGVPYEDDYTRAAQDFGGPLRYMQEALAGLAGHVSTNINRFGRSTGAAAGAAAAAISRARARALGAALGGAAGFGRRTATGLAAGTALSIALATRMGNGRRSSVGTMLNEPRSTLELFEPEPLRRAESRFVWGSDNLSDRAYAADASVYNRQIMATIEPNNNIVPERAAARGVPNLLNPASAAGVHASMAYPSLLRRMLGTGMNLDGMGSGASGGPGMLTRAGTFLSDAVRGIYTNFSQALRGGMLGAASALSIAVSGRSGRGLGAMLPNVSSIEHKEETPLARAESRFVWGSDNINDRFYESEARSYNRYLMATQDVAPRASVAAATTLAADPKVAAAAAQAAANTPQARAAAAGPGGAGGDGGGGGDGGDGGGGDGDAGEEPRRKGLSKDQIAERSAIISRLGQVLAGAGNTMFTPGVSSVGGALGGAAIGAAELLQMRGAHTFAAGGSAGGFIGATAVLTGLNAIKSGFDRGYAIRGQAEPLYSQAEPMFMREARQRSLLGTSDAEDQAALTRTMAAVAAGDTQNPERNRLLALRAGYSAMKAKRAAPDFQDYGEPGIDISKKIADIDAELAAIPFETTGAKVSKAAGTLASQRFGMLKQQLGDFMGMGDALKTYESFRATSGVARMQSLEAGKALRTGMLAGISPDLLAAASAVGASPGQVGGGLRLGKDQFTDIGTLRYQQESLLRANMVGAPANQILQETLQRQAALAAIGATTNFDRDALMQRTMLDAGVAPQQMTTISNQLTGMRTSALERNMAPRRAVMAAMLEASAYMRGGTYAEGGRILATESDAERLEKAISTGMFSGDLLNFSAGGLDPRNPKGMEAALRAIGSGATQGKAQAEGLADLTPSEYARTAINQFLTWSGIGGQADMTKQATIVDLQSRLDEAAKSMVSSADSLKALTASLGSNFLTAPSYGSAE